MLPPQTLRTIAMAALALAVAACSGQEDAPKSSQVAAKVGNTELTVHQINFLLQNAPNVPPDRVPALRREALDRLIEQEALVQAANEKKLAADPQVQQQLEAARRQILAQAYLRQVAASVTAPDAAAVDKFYSDNPALFRGRRVWRFAEIGLPMRPLAWPEIQKALLPTKTIAEAAQVLRARGLDLPIAQNVQRASEEFPLDLLAKLGEIKDGEVVIYPRGQGIVIAQLIDSREAPVDEKTARPAIEQALLNRARAEAVQAEAKRVREAATVAFLGEFAESGPAKADAEKAAADKATQKATPQPAAAAAAAAAAVAQPSPPSEIKPGPAANEPIPAEDAEALAKGLKGLK